MVSSIETIIKQLGKELTNFAIDQWESGSEPQPYFEPEAYCEMVTDRLRNPENRWAEGHVTDCIKLVRLDHSENKYNNLLLWGNRYLDHIRNQQV